MRMPQEPLDTEDTSDLAARVRRVEDHIAISALIASYGPAIDSGSGDVAEKLFAEDATYDSGPFVVKGGAAVGKMMVQPQLDEMRAAGCAHALGAPLVRVSGDSAVAVCHDFLVLRQGEGFVVSRAVAVYWEFRRNDDGTWLITRRVNRPLDGSTPAQELFRQGLLEVWSN